MPELGLGWEYYTVDRLEWYGKVNLLKGGLMFTDMATTVSPTHSQELRTAAGGFGLQEVYQWMGDRFTGVLNGIDQQMWDPQRDPLIAARYSADAIEGKRALQGRHATALRAARESIRPARRPCRPDGDPEGARPDRPQPRPLPAGSAVSSSSAAASASFEEALAHLRAAMPHRIGVQTTFDDETEHVLMAGSDIYMMPSQYEPCGLTQMRAQRYGTIPVARRVGGLPTRLKTG